MARRLTTFSKLVITIIIVAIVFFGAKWVLDNTGVGKSLGTTNDTEDFSSSASSSEPIGENRPIRIGVVTWGGYAGGQYFNEGFNANKQSRFYKDYGFPVEFKVMDDVEASMAAWKKGELDLHWYTVDAFPTIVGGLKDFDPVILWQADWSRGGDAIVVRRGISNASDLKGKKIAVAELTPSHSFLLWLLDAGGLKPEDVTIIPQASAVNAAEAFKSQSVDAAVVWSPDDEACLRAVPGSRVLESTKSASNIIADVFFAKREFVDKNRNKLQQLYEGWMKGAAEINSSSAAKSKAVKILSEGLAIPQSDAEVAINNVRLATHGDNLNFFGLNPDYKGVTADALYRRMAEEYQKLGFAEANVATWRSVGYPGIAQSTQLAGNENAAEAQKTFAAVTETEATTREAIATKRVSISFRTGEFQLDENAKYIIDREFVEIAKAFGNARIRIEGNTDNVGNRASNIALSKKRAEAVKNYLITQYSMDPNRFIVVGNGPDKAIADNGTESGRAQNRRTDFELIRE